MHQFSSPIFYLDFWRWWCSPKKQVSIYLFIYIFSLENHVKVRWRVSEFLSCFFISKIATSFAWFYSLFIGKTKVVRSSALMNLYLCIGRGSHPRKQDGRLSILQQQHTWKTPGFRPHTTIRIRTAWNNFRLDWS